MIKYIALIRPGHNGKVIPVDGHDVRRVWAEETANGSKVIGEYSDKDIARRHMLLALEAYNPVRRKSYATQAR
jgi:hypothetical protein